MTTIQTTRIYVSELSFMLKRAAESDDPRELRLALELIRRAARELDPESLPPDLPREVVRSRKPFRRNLPARRFAREGDLPPLPIDRVDIASFSDDPVQAYLREVPTIPPLAKDEEAELSHHVLTNDQQAESARQRLLKQTLPWWFLSPNAIAPSVCISWISCNSVTAVC